MTNKLIEDLEDVRNAVVNRNTEYANLKLQKMITLLKRSEVPICLYCEKPITDHKNHLACGAVATQTDSHMV